MEDGQQFKIGFIIQARMGSSRLPGKILKKLPFKSKKTILENIVLRLKESSYLSKIIVATSTKSNNNILEKHVKEDLNLDCYRGDENDVLSRFIEIQNKEKFDIIIRITADNPCIDIQLLDETIKNHIISKADFTYSLNYPIGMNYEIIDAKKLELIKNHNQTNDEKEHVTLYMRNRPSQYKLNYITDKRYENLDLIRLTVDTPLDYYLQCILHDKLPDFFNLNDIQKLIISEPWIFEINKNICQQKCNISIEEEITKSIEILELNNFNHSAKILFDKLSEGNLKYQ